MKAIAVIPKRREVQLIDVELPTLSSSTSVKLRTLEIGVCGTDREICTFEYGTPPPGSEYLVIGHESLGEVVEVVCKEMLTDKVSLRKELVNLSDKTAFLTFGHHDVPYLPSDFKGKIADFLLEVYQ